MATCPAGVEELVAGELRGLRGGTAAEIAPERGAVTFRGDWRTVYAANLELRCANRVLVELSRSAAANDRELAHGAAWLLEGEHDWCGLHAGALLAPERSISVSVAAAGSRLTDVRWIAQRTKDGLVDAQRRRFEQRSSVDREAADVPLRVLLRDDVATYLLDTSREPLDRRGYRVRAVDAPLREHLAAACVLAADSVTGRAQRGAEEEDQIVASGPGAWRGGPILDPMCGSATLLVEAAWHRLGLPPGRLRERWMFEDLPHFDRGVWSAVRAAARADVAISDDRGNGAGVRLFGADIDGVALEAARSNLGRAGLLGSASLRRGDRLQLEAPPGPGLLLLNPPYGERIGPRGSGAGRARRAADPAHEAPTADAWRRLGDLFKQRYRGWRAVVLAGGEGLGKEIGLRPSLRLPVRNGPLEARILVFDLY